MLWDSLVLLDSQIRACLLVHIIAVCVIAPPTFFSSFPRQDPCFGLLCMGLRRTDNTLARPIHTGRRGRFVSRLVCLSCRVAIRVFDLFFFCVSYPILYLLSYVIFFLSCCTSLPRHASDTL